MMKQHTPGPWLIEAETCHSGDIATVHNTAEKWVTIYAPHWMETGMGEQEQSANARLIAAAPDLLEALESAWLWMENQADGQSKGGHATFDLMMLREQRDLARAAIAKATGEQA